MRIIKQKYFLIKCTDYAENNNGEIVNAVRRRWSLGGINTREIQIKLTSADPKARTDIQRPELKAMFLEIRTDVVEIGDSEKFLG